MEKFTCSNCSQEKEIEKLANTVEVYGSEPVKTCRSCYNLFHNPPKEKKEEKRFFCSFCRFDVVSIRYKIRVAVSEPNELGLKNGGTYNFCSACRKKVVEYNEGEDDKEPEI